MYLRAPWATPFCKTWIASAESLEWTTLFFLSSCAPCRAWCREWPWFSPWSPRHPRDLSHDLDNQIRPTPSSDIYCDSEVSQTRSSDSLSTWNALYWIAWFIPPDRTDKRQTVHNRKVLDLSHQVLLRGCTLHSSSLKRLLREKKKKN